MIATVINLVFAVILSAYIFTGHSRVLCRYSLFSIWALAALMVIQALMYNDPRFLAGINFHWAITGAIWVVPWCLIGYAARLNRQKKRVWQPPNPFLHVGRKKV